MTLLFVYGTLRSGGGREWMLDGCTLVRAATVAGVLYDLGDYPALVLGPADPVHGEIWRCPDETVRALDSYEGVEEGLFRRVTVPVEEGACWVYVAGAALRGRIERADRIETGAWTPPAP